MPNKFEDAQPVRTLSLSRRSPESSSAISWHLPQFDYLSTRNTMANVTLDSQIFYTLPVTADPKSTTPNLGARDRGPSVASSRGLRTPQHATNGPQRGIGTAFQDDAVLISSDDESDYGDLDDGKYDISFPPIEELLRAAGRKDAEPGSVAAIDKSFSASPGAGGNSDAVEPSVTEECNPNGDVASSQQQQTCHLRRSPALPSATALPRPSSGSPGLLQVEQDRPIPAGSASCEAEQASTPEDTTCGNPDGGISRATAPGGETEHTPSPGHLSRLSPSLLEEGTDRESTPHRDSGGESDGGDEAGPPLAKPRSGLRRNVIIGHGVHRSLRNSRVDIDPKGRGEGIQQSDGQDNSSEDEDIYHPPSASERDQDEEDDDILPPQRKRPRTSSPAQPRTSTKRTRLNGGTSGSQHVQTSALDRKRSGRRSVPSPPSSQGSGDEEASVQIPMAKFEEWLLEDAVLKRVTANGLATFQLQFTWDTCANHRRKDPTTERLQYQSPVKMHPTTKRGISTRARFTPEEDALLVELKNQGLPWQHIHKQFTDAFPQRERRIGSLQVHYCTKLKGSD